MTATATRVSLKRQEAHTILGSSYVQTYGYDANANRTSIGYPSGRVGTYSFDEAGRPLTASGTLGGQTTSYVTAAAYLPFGPIQSLSLGNGTTETRTYNSRYLPLTNSLTAGATTLAQYTYTNDPAGNITAITDGTSAAFNRTFAYDDLNRLITANTGSALWGTGSYTYDRMGNMLTATLGAASRTFTHQGMTPKINTATGLTSAMSYDPAGNELDSPAGDPGGGAPAAIYSPRNLLQFQFVREYDRCLEAHNHPECLLPDPVQLWLSNLYDGRGVRVASTDVIISENIDINAPEPEPRLYFYTPELTMLNLVSPSTARTADIIWFGNRPIADHDQLTPRYTFTDHLGTPILQTSSTATITWYAEYEPFGNLHQLRAGTTPDDQPLRFPGQQVTYVTAAGEENYNIFRWYRSGWGRYTQADPIGLTDGVNMYAYAHGDPLTLTDPLGLAARVCCKPIPNLGSFLHCYIDMYDKQGNHTTYGLHEEQGLKGNYTTGALKSVIGTTKGIVQKNYDEFDNYYQATCGPWTDDPCGETNACVEKAVGQYPPVSKYQNFPGKFVNSNTFAGTIAAKCKLSKPVIPKKSAPGWGNPQPPPYKP